jgi:DNA polymerase-3 subunit delta'
MSAEAATRDPRHCFDLMGHDEAERLLARAYRSGRLPHAWLLHGPRGIGKATLAFRFARALLASQEDGADLLAVPAPADDLAVDPGDPAVGLIVSGAHPDLRVVAPGYDEKRNRQRTEIVVDDIRDLGAFLRLTPAMGGWRVAIVDGAEAMNRHAANALLKSLEEPPRKAVLLLVSHAPGRLLPTIRSRCSALALRPLPAEAVLQLLSRHAPDLGAEDAHLLAALSEGSIGRALALLDGGGLALWRDLVALLGSLPDLDVLALHRLADQLARKDAEDAFRLGGELLLDWLHRQVREAASGRIEPERLPGERTLAGRVGDRRSLDQWLGLWEKTAGLLAQAQGLNLDRKQVLLTAFLTLEDFAKQR